MAKVTLGMKPQDLVTVIALVISGAVTYFVAMPQAQALKDKQSTLQAKLAQAQELNQRAADLKSVAGKLPQYSDSIERLSLAMPKDEQTIEGLVQARTIIERSGMAMVSLTPGKSKDNGLPISFSLTGPYDSVSRFIRLLNANLRPVSIDSLTITPAGEQKGGGVNLVIETGFQHGASTAVDPATGSVPPVLPGVEVAQ